MVFLCGSRTELVLNFSRAAFFSTPWWCNICLGWDRISVECFSSEALKGFLGARGRLKKTRYCMKVHFLCWLGNRVLSWSRNFNRLRHKENKILNHVQELFMFKLILPIINTHFVRFLCRIQRKYCRKLSQGGGETGMGNHKPPPPCIPSPRRKEGFFNVQILFLRHLLFLTAQ